MQESKVKSGLLIVIVSDINELDSLGVTSRAYQSFRIVQMISLPWRLRDRSSLYIHIHGVSEKKNRLVCPLVSEF